MTVMLNSVLRYEVLRRDGFQCRTCGSKAPDVELEVDHIRPVALGGLDVPENLQALCRSCNRGKSATPADAAMAEAVRDRHDEFMRARSEAAEIIRQERKRIDPIIAAVDGYWGLSRFGRESLPLTEWEEAPRPPHWEAALREFLMKGLTEEEALGFVDVAYKTCRGSDTMWGRFYYLCRDHVDMVDNLAQRLMDRRGGASR